MSEHGHILIHLPPNLRPWAEDFATTVDSLDIIAKRHDYTDSMATRYGMAIRDMLGITTGNMWRFSLIRLYYGIDPCWCEVP